MGRLVLPALALGLAAVLAGCGGEEDADPRAAPTPTASAPADVPPVTEPPTATRSPSATSGDVVVPTPPPDLDTTIGLQPVLGADASWPQCPVGMGIPEKRSSGAPPPLPEAEYVILGLTNGPGFTPNPCLADQVAAVRAQEQMLGTYSVASFPDAATLDRYAADGPFEADTTGGRLANVGYQQARFNVATMDRAGAVTPVVWIDVEPVPDFGWSTDRAANAAVVQGVARGYRDAGYRIGIYSTPLLWEGVVGDFRLGVPEWRAAGQTSRDEALRRCGDDNVIQGGQAVLGQWVEAGRDQNVTCPGIVPEQWFHRY